MNIEMDDNTAWTTIAVAFLATTTLIVWMVYRYNLSFLEKGYVQVQLDGNKSQNTMWTKTNYQSELK